ncbi:MAG: hypothetical protein M9894_27710 [Planctomycetes bacterium]|nr:hypothetical protein [Planctomycetota bacterium]
MTNDEARAARLLRWATRAELAAAVALLTAAALGGALLRSGAHWTDGALGRTGLAVGLGGLLLLALGRLGRPAAAAQQARWALRRLARVAGAALVLAPLVSVEVGCRLLAPGAAGPVIAQGTSEELYEHDPLLGYRPRRPLQVRAWKTADGAPIYEATYTIDAAGRRVVPASAPPGGQGPLVLFLGCSNTFGEGVNDDETMAHHLALRAGGRAEVVNLGFCGYGPQQLLARLERGDVDDLVAGREVVAIYPFIDAHVNRAVGSMGIVTAWGADMPCYEVEDGAPRLQGSLVGARPVRSWAYALLSRSAAVRRQGLDLPRLRDPHFGLVAAIVDAAARRLSARAARATFHVAYLPGVTRGERLTPHLAGTAARVLDYSQLLPDDARWRFDHDFHLTPAAHAVLGARLHDDALGAGGQAVALADDGR